jgi:hypothetical protein
VLLPDKHLRLAESILGFAALVVSSLTRRKSFDELWKQIRDQLDTPAWPAAHSVDNFVLALCFLFSIGAIDVSPSGELFRCD